MKKILYIYIGNINEVSGVTKKIHGIISEFDKRNVSCTLFSLSDSIVEPGYASENQYLLPVVYAGNLSRIYEELSLFIKKNAPFDIYFFRYPLAGPELYNLIKTHPFIFTFEHNTKELPEIKHQALSWVRKFRVKPTLSYYRLIKNTLVKPLYNEIKYGRKILKYAKGGVAVTEEISEYERHRFPDYNCKIVSNGIAVEKTVFYNRFFEKGNILNLLFMANSNVNWHGVDLILSSFSNYKENNIRIYLIGEIDNELKKNAENNPNIIVTGFLKGNDLNKYLKDAHVGLGSFALYRKNLNEASTLKIREYWASGLPVLLGHKDTDAETSKILKDYSYYVNARLNDVNWSEIYEWAANLYQMDRLNARIREEAFKQIDFSSKVDLLLQL